MKTIDSGKDKVKQICDALKRETLDPAKKEADAIIHQAKEEGVRIIEDAKRDAERIHEEAKERIEEERNVFKASIHLACRQSLEALRQTIEEKLFSPELEKLLAKPLKDSHVVAGLISAIIHGIEKEGIDSDLKVIIGKEVSAKAVSEEIAKSALARLKKEEIQVGDVEGGALVKIVDQNITIEMTTESLKALVSNYIRDSFRSIIF